MAASGARRKPDSDTEDDDGDDGGGVRGRSARGVRDVDGNDAEDVVRGTAAVEARAAAPLETAEARAARKRAAKLARREFKVSVGGADDAVAMVGSMGATRRCKICDGDKALEAFPASQLRKARSACLACCAAQAERDAPNAERKRKLNKREKLAEALEARKKKRAEREALEKDKAPAADAEAPAKKAKKEKDDKDAFVPTKRYDPTVDDSSSSSSSSSSEDEEGGEDVASKKPQSGGEKNDAKDAPSEEDLELRSRQVFVGGIPFNKTAEEIEEAFIDDMLTVESIDCMTFADTGRFRGIAIVTFASAQTAKEALRWHDTEWDGMNLVVKPYEPKKAKKEVPKQEIGKIEGQHVAFVANLDYSVTEDTLREAFASDSEIKEIRLGVDKNTGDFKGFAHIEFVSDGDLERAMKKDGTELIGGRRMKVTYATARRAAKPAQKDKERGKPAKLKASRGRRDVKRK